MRYTVVWVPDALVELADIYNNAPDKAAVTNAANQIEFALAHAPDQYGDPYNGDRLYRVAPLEVVYTISEDDRLVRVLQVFYLP
jgi:hypothetical protein